MQHSVTANVKPRAVKRGKAHRATIERLNGGGFKTMVEHHPASSNGNEWQPSPKPIEAAHKNYKGARKAVDDHFADDAAGEPMED